MNFKNIAGSLLFFLLSFSVFGQYKISGSFLPLAGQQVKLVGFRDFGIYTIDSTTVSKEGKFTLGFGKKDKGMGYLSAADNKAYFVVLEKGDIKLKGTVLSAPESVSILSGKENKLFVKYASEHPRREQALSAWDYLAKIYTQDSLFEKQILPRKAIENEIERIEAEDSLFLSNFDRSLYVSWYLPLRKLVSSVSNVAQYQMDKIPVTIKAFRELDYTDARLYKSGLLRETLESQFWLIENSGNSLDSVYAEMKISIDSIIDDLANDTEKLNKITSFLFKLLEKRSLFKASEYLALKVLNQDNCIINDDLASQLESYHTMKIGKTAPDFEFSGGVFAPGYPTGKSPKKLSDLDANYTVLVFGASWCPACAPELMQIAKFYENWKKNRVEVVFVSLDEDKETFKKFVNPFPFISTSDYKKWDSPIVKNYHVFATPTLFLLDKKRKIVLRPHSAEQANSWIDWYLEQGNK